jgi:hypothetical protein
VAAKAGHAEVLRGLIKAKATSKISWDVRRCGVQRGPEAWTRYRCSPGAARRLTMRISLA